MSQVSHYTALTKEDMVRIVQRLQANPENVIEKHYALLALEASMRNVDPKDQPLWYTETREGTTAAIAKFAGSPSTSNADSAGTQVQVLTLFLDAAKGLVSSNEKGSYNQIIRDAVTSKPKAQDLSSDLSTIFQQSETVTLSAQRLANRLNFLLTSSGADNNKVASIHASELAELLRFIADATDFRAHLIDLSTCITAEKWDQSKTKACAVPRYTWPLVSEEDGMIFSPVDTYAQREKRPEAHFDDDEGEDEAYYSCDSSSGGK